MCRARFIGEKLLDTVTSLTLLEGLRDPHNEVAWRRFTARYEPMVLSFARGMGLGDSDARDAGQETMLAFVQAYRNGGYDRSKGRLRSWLFGIAHRKVIDIFRRWNKEQVLTDRSDATAFLESIESPERASGVWEHLWERTVLEACMAEVAEQTTQDAMESFRLYVLEEWPPAEVAEHLGMSRNAVYINKSRIIERLREVQRQMEEIW